MAKPKRMTYFKANLEDKPGALLGILKGLKTKNIGLKGLWGFATSSGRAEVYVVPNDAEKLRTLWKSSGTIVEEGAIFHLGGPDKTGVLLKPLEALAAAGVNLNAAHAIGGSGTFGSFLWVKPEDVEKAAKALGG